MKLAVDPMNVEWKEVDELASNALTAKVASILLLSPEKKPLLKETLQNLYSEFLLVYHDVEQSAPEYVENEALMKVSKDAEQLVNSLNELLSVGSADKRLFKELSGFNHPLFRYRDSYGTWDYILSDPHNPHIKLRSLIADIKAAAESACDTPCKIENSDGKNQDVIDLFLDAYNSEAHQEERRKRKLERKTPRDLPLRKSIQLLKGFFDEHVEIPFTAGKYYPELGYKSHAFEAVKLVLEQIYPDISDRKIASLMQEMVTQ